MRFRLPLLVLPLALSAAAWAVVFATFPPAQQSFPLIDEWAFGPEAIGFASGAGIHYDGWASMPLLGLWLWSAPFILVLGKNWFALRVSTIVLGWLGLIALYDLLRQLKVSDWQAVFATTAFAVNPIFFLSQGTYMTDVPALSFALIALCFYARALRDENQRWLVPAAAVALLGVITRQHAIAAPLTAGILLALSPKLRLRPAWLAAVLVPAAVGVVTHLWFVARPDAQAMSPELPTLFRLAFTPWFILHTVGLAILPVLLLDPWPRSWPRFSVALAVALGIAYFWYRHDDPFAFDGLYPYTTGYIHPNGVCCVARGAAETDLMLTRKAEALLTLIGCIGVAALVDRLPRRVRGGGMLMIFGMFQIMPLFLTPSLFDRYTLFLIPCGLYLALPERVRDGATVSARWLPRLAGQVAVALFAVISVALMHDWLAWNEARWQLGRRAVEHGIDPWDIEGGFEWDGWYAPKPLPRQRLVVKDKTEPILLSYTREHFPHVRGLYALSFSVLRHTASVDAEPFRLWLKRGARDFYLVRRVQPPSLLAHSQRP